MIEGVKRFVRTAATGLRPAGRATRGGICIRASGTGCGRPCGRPCRSTSRPSNAAARTAIRGTKFLFVCTLSHSSTCENNNIYVRGTCSRTAQEEERTHASNCSASAPSGFIRRPEGAASAATRQAHRVHGIHPRSLAVALSIWRHRFTSRRRLLVFC